MANEPSEPNKTNPFVEEEKSAAELRKASDELKTRIAQARGRSDMPFDSTLGNPNWDKNAADGHLDVRDDDDDG